MLSSIFCVQLLWKIDIYCLAKSVTLTVKPSEEKEKKKEGEEEEEDEISPI